MKRELWWWKHRNYVESGGSEQKDEEGFNEGVIMEMEKIGYQVDQIK